MNFVLILSVIKSSIELIETLMLLSTINCKTIRHESKYLAANNQSL